MVTISTDYTDYAVPCAIPFAGCVVLHKDGVVAKAFGWTRPVLADNFSQIAEQLEALPNQCMGSETAVCEETGEMYIGILESALARPKDQDIVEQMVAQRAAQRISQVLEGRSGTIYRREKFGVGIGPAKVVLRYDDNGPDYHEMVERRCYFDSDWVCINCYVRFTRAKT